MKKYTFTESFDTRSGFGAGLHELGKKNPNVVTLCSDVSWSLRMDAFIKDFCKRITHLGIAEWNMISIASALTAGV